MSLKNDIKDTLKWLGIFVLSGALGAGGAIFALDRIEDYHRRQGDGLPLLVDGVHMKQGDHNVVITDQFYNMLSYGDTPKEDVDLAIGGIKQAYINLNELNSKINFNLCTTVDEVSTNYNIPKIETLQGSDIPLYITTEAIAGNSRVMAETKWAYDAFTYELKDESIVYCKKYLFAVWKEYPTLEETLNPYNSAAYTVTAHESMHLMGFSHIDNKESIMNTYLSTKSPKDFTEYDKQIIDKYNVQFYGAEAQYTEQSNTEYTVSDAVNNNYNLAAYTVSSDNDFNL